MVLKYHAWSWLLYIPTVYCWDHGHVDDSTDKIFLISDVIKNRDLFNRITSDTGHVLYDLLLPKRNRNRALRDRGHDLILPRVKTEHFKQAFVNKYLFRFIS